jgi:predicted house-cleaning noncanonical NTP pyrophosphatase (MazG superfamily)
MTHYDGLPKLVRDKIPKIAEENNDEPVVEELTDNEVKDYVTRKICEEAEELHESKENEELADLLEVVEKYIELLDVQRDDLDEIRSEKNGKRGSFKENYILKETKHLG